MFLPLCCLSASFCSFCLQLVCGVILFLIFFIEIFHDYFFLFNYVVGLPRFCVRFVPIQVGDVTALGNWYNFVLLFSVILD